MVAQHWYSIQCLPASPGWRDCHKRGMECQRWHRFTARHTDLDKDKGQRVSRRRSEWFRLVSRTQKRSDPSCLHDWYTGNFCADGDSGTSPFLFFLLCCLSRQPCSRGVSLPACDGCSAQTQWGNSSRSSGSELGKLRSFGNHTITGC